MTARKALVYGGFSVIGKLTSSFPASVVRERYWCFVESKSRYVVIVKLLDRKVVTINFVLEQLMGAQLHVRSVTIDNDVCFRHHPEMSRILGAPDLLLPSLPLSGRRDKWRR